MVLQDNLLVVSITQVITTPKFRTTLNSVMYLTECIALCHHHKKIIDHLFYLNKISIYYLLVLLWPLIQIKLFKFKNIKA